MYVYLRIDIYITYRYIHYIQIFMVVCREDVAGDREAGNEKQSFFLESQPATEYICLRNEFSAGVLNLRDFGSQTARNRTGEDEERARGGPRENIRARETR